MDLGKGPLALEGVEDMTDEANEDLDTEGTLVPLLAREPLEK